MMKELVEYVAKALVDAPDEVEVTEVEPNQIELRVAEDDRGKVIGRKGRTAHAMRVILAAASEDGEASLDILD